MGRRRVSVEGNGVNTTMVLVGNGQEGGVTMRRVVVELKEIEG